MVNYYYEICEQALRVSTGRELEGQPRVYNSSMKQKVGPAYVEKGAMQHRNYCKNT